MMVKAESLLLTLFRRSRHVPRRMHQAVALLPRTATIPPQAVVSDGTVDNVLAEYAKRGNIQDFESLISRIPSAPPTEHQRDLHVKTHVVNASVPSSITKRFPTSALALLHQYEADSNFAPIRSYTRVISALFNVETCPSSRPGLGRAVAQAQAWDLFSHMRYVAHPVPDARLYAVMIRACGLFSRPEPERALDLWTEMQEHGIKPTKAAYEAVIRVCGRAGPEWLGEGTRLAREMSDRYSITDMSGRGLWCALLEGCKRAGDLERARWILAEAVRGGDDENSMVNAELMAHIFHTYASYKPPFKREATRLLNGSAALNEDSTNETQAKAIPSPDILPDVLAENTERMPLFSRLPPQSSSDVIAEARALFDRILQDKYLSTQEARGSPQDGLLLGRFAHVELTTVLLNTYLSVFYRHASMETARETFNSLFAEGDSPGNPDEHSYIGALERCARARAEDRPIAVRWGKDVWRRWEVMEANGVRDGRATTGLFARLIEKAHAAMRRILVLSGDIDGAQELLRLFVSRYPPNAVQQLATLGSSPVMMSTEAAAVRLFAKPLILSTRTVLTNSVSSTARPLVRLTSVVSPKDDRVPPIVTFSDVDLLHTRLAEHGRIKDLGYIKWVCMAYTNALKKRRDAALKAVPTSRDEVVG